jgi:hypothetical protein
MEGSRELLVGGQYKYLYKIKDMGHRSVVVALKVVGKGK